MTRQPLWFILCCLLEKGRKDRRDSGDEREEQGRKRKMNKCEETEEIKTIPPMFLPAVRVAGLAQL